MNAHANQGFAARLGYALGTGVRFFLHDRRPVLRWVKRAVLFAALAIALSQTLTWLASAFMTLLCIGLVGLAVVKGDFSMLNESSQRDVSTMTSQAEVESVSELFEYQATHQYRD